MKKELIVLSIFLANLVFCQTVVVDSMNVRRGWHTSTLLPNGEVLITGGTNKNGSLKSCEIFSPITNKWREAAPLNVDRSNHYAFVMESGKVFVFGGNNTTGYAYKSEIYDPEKDEWTIADSLNFYRQASGDKATLLDDGRILVTGFDLAEIYDPIKDKWAIADSMVYARDVNDATKLSDGKVLVSGGRYYHYQWIHLLNMCEIFDPVSNKFSRVSDMHLTRDGHSGVLLGNGNVLVSGGEHSLNVSGCEIYDPASDSWTLTDSLNYSRKYHKSILINNSNVIFIGGIDPINKDVVKYIEIYDESNGVEVIDSLINPVKYSKITLLGDGRILVTGGFTGSYSSTIYHNHTEIIDLSYLGVKSETDKIASNYKLFQNYPNPFNPSTTIRFQIPESSDVKLTIFNSIGEKVSEPVNSKLEAGRYSFKFDASGWASGVYFYKLKTLGLTQTKKMLLIK